MLTKYLDSLTLYQIMQIKLVTGIMILRITLIILIMVTMVQRKNEIMETTNLQINGRIK